MLFLDSSDCSAVRRGTSRAAERLREKRASLLRNRDLGALNVKFGCLLEGLCLLYVEFYFFKDVDVSVREDIQFYLSK